MKPFTFLLVLLALVDCISSQACDIGGATSRCRDTCFEDAEEEVNAEICKAPNPKCCKFLCAGPGSLCLPEGATCSKGTVGAIAVTPCPSKGVCCQGIPAPTNWPEGYAWPPVEWPPHYTLPVVWIERYQYLPYYFPDPPKNVWPKGSDPLPVADAPTSEGIQQPDQPEPGQQPGQQPEQEQPEEQQEQPEQEQPAQPEQPKQPEQPEQGQEQPEQPEQGQGQPEQGAQPEQPQPEAQPPPKDDKEEAEKDDDKKDDKDDKEGKEATDLEEQPEQPDQPEQQQEAAGQNLNPTPAPDAEIQPQAQNSAFIKKKKKKKSKKGKKGKSNKKKRAKKQ